MPAKRAAVCSAAILSLVAIALGTIGCSSERPAAPAAEDAAAEAEHTHADGTVHAHEDDLDEAEAQMAEDDKAAIEAALAALSPEDRALAEKQKLCPVSDEPLGSMGTPIKVELEGHAVFVCCKGCEGSLHDEPDKYLAKLGLKQPVAP